MISGVLKGLFQHFKALHDGVLLQLHVLDDGPMALLLLLNLPL